MTAAPLEHRVLGNLWVVDDDMGKRARENRERTIETVISQSSVLGIRAEPRMPALIAR